MLKNLVLVLLFTLFFIIAPAGVYFLGYSQTTNFDDQKIKYTLPYPGILPDNPLFFVKNFRDKVLELMTRDNTKKAHLYLLLSDKKASMALGLEKKGKDKLAAQTITQGEQYFTELVDILKEAKKQGVSPEGEFVLNIKLSNEKHKEILETLLKKLPQGEATKVNDALKMNEEVRKEMSKM